MEAIEELRTSPKTSHVFETQYMQNPQPKEGIVFAKDELMYFRKEDIDLSTAQARCAFVDVADKGNDNHAIPFGYIIGQKVFIPDVVFTKEATGTNVPMTIIKANEHRPEYMQVESNFGGSMYSGLLNMSKDPKMNGYTGVITMNQSSNKHTRILTCEGFVKRYVYFLEPTEYSVGSEYELFMKNLCEYTRTSGDVKHDDAPDSLAGLVKMMISYYPHLFDGVTIQDPQ
jgi:predicted phage terminase large subunit-like protein